MPGNTGVVVHGSRGADGVGEDGDAYHVRVVPVGWGTDYYYEFLPVDRDGEGVDFLGVVTAVAVFDSQFVDYASFLWYRGGVGEYAGGGRCVSGGDGVHDALFREERVV